MRVILSLLFLVNIIYASVAVVSAFNGSANIYRDNKQLKVYVGVEINKKDTIKTNNNTKIQLIFKDNTRITIGKNSQFSVSDYLYDETKPNASKAKFKFTKGLFRTISGRIGKLNKKQFKISVKSATIGIRGTKFDVLVTASFVKVGVYKGTVYFENLGQSVDVKEDHFFVYEYLNNKKIIKQGRFKESFEFKDDNKQRNKLSDNIDIDTKSITTNINTNEVKNQVEDIIDLNNNIKNELVKEVVYTDNNLEYGYWIDPLNDNKKVNTFIDSKTLTPENIVQGYITDQMQAGFKGNISSIITDANGEIYDRAGSITVDLDFEYERFSSSISIDNDQYRAIVDGDIATNGFTSTSVMNDYGEIEVRGGSLDGKYYGENNIDSVGGTFELKGADDSTIKGVFVAIPQ